MFRKKHFAIVITLLLMAAVFSGTRAKAADSNSSAGTVTISSGYLNVRSAPSSSSSVVSTLQKGSYVTLTGKSGSWWRVEYRKGAYGYCHQSYVTQVSGAPVRVSLSYGSLNVRSGPGTGYAKTASLYNGETVIKLSSSGGWSRILYAGTKTGYVSSAYIKGGSARSISLDVPSYKQTDNRWRYTTIGASGKNMGQIGCATTAIAMIESYRTGSAIYPDKMAAKLSYTPTGNVYWPSDYTAVYSQEGYLQTILRELTEGDPVLLGCKKKDGSQHWIVVTGYSGGATPTASDFTINDPGSSSRTVLSQFLSSYPIFYKYFTVN